MFVARKIGALNHEAISKCEQATKKFSVQAEYLNPSWKLLFLQHADFDQRRKNNVGFITVSQKKAKFNLNLRITCNKTHKKSVIVEFSEKNYSWKKIKKNLHFQMEKGPNI